METKKVIGINGEEVLPGQILSALGIDTESYMGTKASHVNNVVSVFDGNLVELKNFDAMIVGVDKNLNLLAPIEGLDLTQLVELMKIKEEVEAGLVGLKDGDCIVSKVPSLLKGSGELNDDKSIDNRLYDNSIEHIICVVVPEWKYGIRHKEIQETLLSSLGNAFSLAEMYDCRNICIGNLFANMPDGLHMSSICSAVVEERFNFSEICIVREADKEGVYRINLALNYFGGLPIDVLYTRLGGDYLTDVLVRLSKDGNPSEDSFTYEDAESLQGINILDIIENGKRRKG